MIDDIALEVNGETTTLRHVMRFAKWRGQSTFIEEAAAAMLIRQAAAEYDIRVSDLEVQQAADSFRIKHELYDTQTTEQWLATNYLTYEDWEELLEDEIIRVKLREELTRNSVRKYFVEHGSTFDAVIISRLVVKVEDVARELRAQIVEDGADFHVLARAYSIDMQTRPAGGYVGPLRRSEMEATVEAAVFGAQPGKTVGPIKTDNGWELIKVDDVQYADLDETMCESIKSLLFSDWLAQRRTKARIRIPLFESQPVLSDISFE